MRLVAGTNRTGGTSVPPSLAGQSRPPSIRTDGTRYTWTLDYDPSAHTADNLVVPRRPYRQLSAAENDVATQNPSCQIEIANVDASR